MGIYQEEEKNFLEKYSQAFSNFLKQNQDEEIYEKISIYNKDSSVLYKLSDENILIDDPKAEQQILNSKINALITGQITAFGEYLSVTVEVYLFPGAKKIGTVTEVGTVQELELFASSIAEQIIPILTNSMPVTLKINLENDEQRKQVEHKLEVAVHYAKRQITWFKHKAECLMIDKNEYKQHGILGCFYGRARPLLYPRDLLLRIIL